MTDKKVIDSFKHEYDFLSNFYPAVVSYCSLTYPTVEHAYQAAKTSDKEQRTQIQLAATPGEAKKLGQRITLRSNWDRQKILVMKKLIRRKFNTVNHYALAEKLAKTWPAKLIEGNHWGDTFWGVCGGIGKNHLGKLLMQRRDELREENPLFLEL